MDLVHLVLALATTQGCSIVHMDVKSTFLHGDFHEEIYMDHPTSFIYDSSLVCRIKKSLYGLKQAPQEWYKKMDSFILSIDFVWCSFDPIVYIWRYGLDNTILALYVDDLLLIDTSHSHI